MAGHTNMHRDEAFAMVPESDQCRLAVQWEPNSESIEDPSPGPRVLVCRRKMRLNEDGQKVPHQGNHLHIGGTGEDDVWFGKDRSGEWMFFPRVGDPAESLVKQYHPSPGHRPPDEFAEMNARLAKAATAMKHIRERGKK